MSVLTVVLVWAACATTPAHAAPEALAVTDFGSLEGIVAAPWPDRDGTAATSKIRIARADMGEETIPLGVVS